MRGIIFVIIICIGAINGRYVGFKKLGNYYITDKDEKSHEKNYHLSLHFQADWMSAKSFCSSYGMGLASIESKHEMQYFMKASEGSYDEFEKVTLIGAIYENNEWISTDFGSKLTIDPSQIEEIDKDGKCLSLIKKGNKKFSYGKVACTNQIYPFICQRMIFKVGENWLDNFNIEKIFGG